MHEQETRRCCIVLKSPTQIKRFTCSSDSNADTLASSSPTACASVRRPTSKARETTLARLLRSLTARYRREKLCNTTAPRANLTSSIIRLRLGFRGGFWKRETHRDVDVFLIFYGKGTAVTMHFSREAVGEEIPHKQRKSAVLPQATRTTPVVSA